MCQNDNAKMAMSKLQCHNDNAKMCLARYKYKPKRRPQ